VALRQTLLITGASSGIGKEITILAGACGHTVIASAPTAALLADIPDSASMKLVIDICDHGSIEKALADIDRAGIKLTCLINNAGYAQPGPIELVDDEQVRRQFEVNVFGTLAMTRAALPHLRAQASPDRHGLIITMSSMLGLVSSPNQGIYAASKHALEGAFSALRMELRTQSIDVVLIQPGWIRTQLLKTALTYAPEKWLEHPVYGSSLKTYFAITAEAESENPTGAAKIAASLAGTPCEVAKTVVRVLERRRPRAHYPVTAMAKWMPRLSRILPTRLWDSMQTRH
jgi:NAD(P)-dependent dehydrogenase (short-subunit alcohol dehydrogenase family)